MSPGGIKLHPCYLGMESVQSVNLPLEIQNVSENVITRGAWCCRVWRMTHSRIFKHFLFLRNNQLITFYEFLTQILISSLNYPSDQMPFGFLETVSEHGRDGLTMWSDLLEVSTDTKVEWAAQPIVSRCQAFSFSAKSASRQARSTLLSPEVISPKNSSLWEHLQSSNGCISLEHYFFLFSFFT